MEKTPSPWFDIIECATENLELNIFSVESLNMVL